MVHNIFLNGKISTVLVYEEDEEDFITSQNPIYEVIKEQAERIEMLEQQNNTLIEQEEVLLHLLEITAKTGTLMARNMKILEEMRKKLQDEASQELNVAPQPQPIKMRKKKIPEKS